MKTPLSILILSFAMAHAQDLDAALEAAAPANEPVQATFKSIRVVTSQSVETSQKGVLNMSISHRFGQYSAGVNDLYGLDFGRIRLGLDYGITEWMDVGFERSNNEGKPVDLSVKFKLLRQTTSGDIPLSVSWFSAGYLMTKTDEGLGYNLTLAGRFSSLNQLIVARKFNERLSLQLSPTLVTRQLRPLNGDDEVALGLTGAGRFKVAKRVALTAEATPMFTGTNINWDPAIAFGVDIETGGHVFQLYVSNSTYLSEDRMYTQTKTGPNSALDIETLALGFNITRGYSF